ncbi:Altered inheritance of mitochondria protein 24, mitochondrial [Erysiphe necator]|uniref:Altered inheritance of mitochondria protein 24, mitochondrial n=1 Tax=Uncinula necator TaxID=52586 RepID=A0A0B1P662_UNCNE|nr:Altered inheritance of mitochondria protein 24, mitochondrial [Erysiphe necator]KHJ34187.1 putative trap-like protein [Erysiphe necator]
MQRLSLLVSPKRCSFLIQNLSVALVSSRNIQISSTSVAECREDALLGDISSDPADAKFEVLGTPYSILSASLSASQNFYTQRGTLIGIHGKPENTRSKLVLLEPFRRSLLGIPFLYQKISSTSPTNLLISTKSPITSFTVLKLDGSIDWMIAQTKALVAWTGQSLSFSPVFNRGLGVAYWGTTKVTGRGLMALCGTGNIYQIQLRDGEEYIVHPGNILAYTISQQHPPQPYRLSNFRLYVPSMKSSAVIVDLKFIQSLRQSYIWQRLIYYYRIIRTFMRQIIWGDQLYLKFNGPMKILISSRATKIGDILTSQEINELAEAKSANPLSLEKNH